MYTPTAVGFGVVPSLWKAGPWPRKIHPDPVAFPPLPAVKVPSISANGGEPSVIDAEPETCTNGLLCVPVSPATNTTGIDWPVTVIVSFGVWLDELKRTVALAFAFPTELPAVTVPENVPATPPPVPVNSTNAPCPFWRLTPPTV